MAMFVPTVHYLEPTCVRQRPLHSNCSRRSRMMMPNNNCGNQTFYAPSYFTPLSAASFVEEKEPSFGFYDVHPFNHMLHSRMRQQQKPRPVPFEASLDLEGFAPEDISVQLIKHKRQLEIRAVSKINQNGMVSEKSMRRTVDLPETCDAEKVKVEMDRRGVLTIRAPALSDASVRQANDDDVARGQTEVPEDAAAPSSTSPEEMPEQTKEEVKPAEQEEKSDKTETSQIMAKAEVHAANQDDAKVTLNAESEEKLEEGTEESMSVVAVEDCGADEEADSVTSSGKDYTLDPELDHVLEEIVPDFRAVVDCAGYVPDTVRVRLESGLLRVTADSADKAEDGLEREFVLSEDKYDAATIKSHLSKDGVLVVEAKPKALEVPVVVQKK